MAAFINRALAAQSPVDDSAILARLGSVGFLLAEREDDLVGVLGWQVENLVVRVTDFLVYPASEHASCHSERSQVYADGLDVPVHDVLSAPSAPAESPARDVLIRVGQALFSQMEGAARELQCEAALLSLRGADSPRLCEFCKMLGYEPRIVADLPKVWQEVAYEFRLGDDETVWMKQLRADRVVHPL